MGKGHSKIEENVEEIDTEFLQELPDEAKNRILEHYDRMKSKLQDLNVECNRLKVDHEQRVFELESQLSSEKAALAQTTTVADYHKNKLADIEEKYRLSEEKVEKFEAAQHEKDLRLSELEHQNHQLELEKNDLCRVLERKTQEIDTLNEEWQAMSKKVTEANQARVAALSRMEEVETAEILVKHKEERWTQDREGYEQRIQMLDKELKERSNELLLMKQQQSLKFLEIENEVEHKREEVVRLEETITHLKEANEDLVKRNESNMEKLRDMRDMQAQGEEHYRNEIMALEKLVSLYKDSSEAAQKKEQELIAGAKELQKLLKQSTEVHKQLEQDRENDCAKYKEELAERNDEIDRMAKELEDANTLIETLRKSSSVRLLEKDVESVSPSAAAAARLLKSGMTLTQLYSEYVTSQENLVVEKEENKRLNSYLEGIIQELEEKAPVMKKQREDYEKAVMTINQLTSQLDNAMQECEKLRVSADDANRMYSSLVRENQRQKTLTADLGKQVKVLLKELEQARGRVVSTDDDDDVSSTEVTSSTQQVISQNLVSFRSIEELQEQNQRLLAVVRDLSEQKDEDEKVATDNRIMELKDALALAQQEFETLREENKRRMSMMESIIRQRDMYKAMLTNEAGDESQVKWPANVSAGGPLMMSTPMPGGGNLPSTPVSTSAATRVYSDEEKKMIREANEALKALQEEFTTYRQQKAENEQILNEQVDTSRKKLSTLTLQNAKLSSQLDFQAERFKILQTNVEGYKKEIAALRDKNQKFAANVVKHEQMISSLRQDLMTTQEKYSNAEVQAQMLRQERDLLKNVEARLTQERDSLLRDQRAQNLLLANLEAIQNNLERSEFETKTQLKRYIDTLEKENAVLKKKIDDIDNQNRSVIATMERQVNDMRNQRDQEVERHKHVKEHADQLNQQLQVLKNELSAAEAKLASSEIRLTPSGQPGAGLSSRAQEDRIRELQVQLSQAQAKIKSLQDQITVAKRHADEFKNMAATFEKNVLEQTKTTEEFQQSAQKELEDLHKKVGSQEKMLNEAEKEKQDLINENIRVTEESHKLNAGLRKQLSETEVMLKEANEAREAAILNEQAARADCANQLKIAQECQEKYERELVMHAADVEALTNVKQELDRYNEQLARLQEQAKEAKSTLAISQESWQGQEATFKSEIHVLKTRISDLENQNTVLHQELEQLSDQMVSIQATKTEQDQEAAQLAQVVENDEANQSPDQLLQVVRFLRKEKDISSTKLEVVQAEANRMKQKVEFLQKQVKELEQTLNQERSQQQATVQTASQHAELMRKLENQNLLQDSNKLLRQERDDLMKQLQDAEAKIKKLESDLAPLQANLKDLTSLRDTLQSEKSALESEVNRWKARTNHLIEQCNKVDPEEQKRLLEERDTLKKKLASTTEELNKLRAQLAQEQQNLSQTQQEVQSLKQSAETKDQEMTALKSALETKDQENEENKKVVQQLKRVGRKYKLQADEAQKELEEVKGQKINQLQTDLNKAQEEIASLKTDLAASRTELTATMTELTNVKAELPELQNKVKEAEQKFANANSNLAVITEKLGSAEYELSEANKQVKLLEEANKELQKVIEKDAESQKQQQQAVAQKEEAARQHQEALTSLRTTIDKLNEDIKKSQADNAKQKEELSESEKKFVAIKSYLQKAKVTIKEKMEQVEKLTNENTELRAQAGNQAGDADDSAVSRLKQQYDDRVTKLETELKDLRQQSQSREGPVSQPQELAKLQRENSELQQKILMMQKQLEVKAQSQTVTTKPTMSAAPVERASTSEAPRTANIRPVQPVRSNTTETRATASIRPMAVTPTTATVTPTATVMPNMMSVTEGETMLLTAMGTPTSQVRPQQQVQIVSPHIDTSEPAVPPVEPEPTPSTSAGPRESTATKRPREQTEHEDAQAKRSRPAEVEPEVSAVVAEPSALETREEDGQGRGVAMVEPSVQEVVPEVTQEVPVEPAQEAPEPAADEEEEEIIVSDEEEATEQEQQQSIHVAETQPYADEELQEEEPEYEEEDICVEVYEEQDEENYEMEGEEQPEDEEGMEEDEGIQEGEEEEEFEVEEEEEEEEEDTDMPEEEEGEGQEDDADVVIVDSDNDEEEDDVVEETPEAAVPSASDQAAVIPPASQVADVAASQALPSPRVPGRGERLSFAPMAQGGTFEEGDDGIVPSTPTLFVPRRSDGFAEAVSSPQVPQGRFVFGATSQEPTTPQPELAQLASQGALGMDDTKMDLSALDDGSGRSIPSTPGSRTPPAIVLTEAPTEVAASTSATSQAGQTTGTTTVTESASESSIPTIQIDEVDAAVTTEEPAAPSPVSQATSSATATPSSSATEVTSEESKEPQPSTSEPQSETNTNQSAATGTSSGPRQQPAKKPKIHRIVWDAPGQNQPASGTTPPQRRGTPRGRAQMARRGTPIRGRGISQQPHFPGGPLPHQGPGYRGGPPIRGRGNRGRPF